jgi:hypothetical protein
MRHLILTTALLVGAPVLAGTGKQEWRFRVHPDDKEIGYHEFVLTQRGDQRELQSEANFECRLLFVKPYEYLHESTETWQGDCLTAIESRTDANGKPYAVKGRLVDDVFVPDRAEEEVELPGCVMTFARWNPAFLEKNRLLNAQNGEIVEVKVSDPEPGRLEVRGTPLNAYRYRLEAGEIDIRLWYSRDRQWLALETEARGGRTLRYELL